MKLSKEQTKEFEANKAKLEKMIKDGFKFPMRTDPNKTKQSIFVQFSLLEKEIGSAAMDDTEKAAYLSYACCSHKEGEYKSFSWERSAVTPNGAQKEIEHYKACISALIDFGNRQAFEKIKAEAQAMENILHEISKTVYDKSQIPQDPLQALHDKVKEIKSIADDKLLTVNALNKLSAKVDKNTSVIEDHNMHRHEKWATVPECIKAVFDMIEVEQKDGKNIDNPTNNSEGMRLKVQGLLKNNDNRMVKKGGKHYYNIADIAEKIYSFYKEFDVNQYVTEFKVLAQTADQLGLNITDKPKSEE